MEHTATPWKLPADDDRHPNDIPDFIAGDIGYRFLIVHPAGMVKTSEIKANAAFIVRACNSHYQLVSALQEAIEELWDRDHSSMDRIQFERANASLFTALSQAGGASE